MAADATVGGAGYVDLAGVLPATAPGFGVELRVATTAVIADADVTVHASLFRIPIEGAVDIDGHTVTLAAPFEQIIDGNSDGLLLNQPASEVIFEQSATFNVTNTATTQNRFTDGTLRFRGNLIQDRQSTGFRSLVILGSEAIFDGQAPQTVTFDNSASSESRFAGLTLDNPAGVTFTDPTTVIGALVVTDGTPIALDADLHLFGTATWAGAGAITSTNDAALVVYDALPATPAMGNEATVRVDGAITMTGDQVVYAPELYIGTTGQVLLAGHTLDVVGDFEQRGDSNGDGVQLTVAGSELIVRGDARFNSLSSGVSTTGELTQGTVTLYGNFSEEAFGTVGVAYNATGTTTVFAGDSPATYSIENTTTQVSFADLTVLNTGGVTALSPLDIKGDLNVIGILDVSGQNVVVDGNIAISASGELITDGSTTWVCGGALQAQGTITGPTPCQ
jgi:hypothetical protein